MNRSPSTVDALLSTRLAAYALEREGFALRSFLEHEFETKESLKSLNSGLKSSLLGAGSLEVLTNGHFLAALTDATEQVQSQKQVISDEVDMSQDDIDSPGRPARPIAIENKAGEKVGKNWKQRITAKLDPDSSAETSSIRRLNSNSRSNSINDHSASKIGPQTVHRKKHRIQDLPQGLDSVGRDQMNSSVRIGAGQASNSMAQRALAAGMGSAWNSKICSSVRQSGAIPRSECSNSMKAETLSEYNSKPGSNGGNFDATAFTGKPGKLESRARGAAGDQLKQCLESLLNHSYEGVDSTSGSKPGRRNAAPDAEKQGTQKHRKSRAGVKNAGPERRPGFTSEPGLPDDSGFLNRTTPGGLRGLVEQAKGSLNVDEHSDDASEASRQVKNKLPQFDAIDSPNNDSGSRVAEIAKLLADEARRAGINLEQFRP